MGCPNKTMAKENRWITLSVCIKPMKICTILLYKQRRFSYISKQVNHKSICYYWLSLVCLKHSRPAKQSPSPVLRLLSSLSTLQISIFVLIHKKRGSKIDYIKSSIDFSMCFKTFIILNTWTLSIWIQFQHLRLINCYWSVSRTCTAQWQGSLCAAG